MTAQSADFTVGGMARGESWKVFKGGHKCQASRESPVDSILPGSTVRPSAAAMASFDVAVANCKGVILLERSASNWSASCSHMRTLSLQNKIHTDILYGPSTGVAHQSSVKVTGDSRSCSSEEPAKWRFLFDVLWSHSQSGGPIPVQRLEVHTHHCLCIIRCLLNVSSVGGCIRLSIEIGDSCCSRGQKLAAEVGREGPSHRWVRI